LILNIIIGSFATSNLQKCKERELQNIHEEKKEYWMVGTMAYTEIEVVK